MTPDLQKLIARLQSALDSYGFGYQALRDLAALCGETLNDPDHELSDSAVVGAYVILDVCLDIASWWDAAEPVTTQESDALREVIFSPLREAISNLGNESMALPVSSALIRAFLHRNVRT